MRSGLLWVLLSSLLLKAAILLWVGEIEPYRDERQYLAAARSLAAGEGLRYPNPRWDPIYQPPVYPLFLGGVHALGGGAQVAKGVQVLLSTLTVGAAYVLLRRTVGGRAALLGAAAFAFEPTLVAFTHYTWSETVFLFLSVPAFAALFDDDGGPARPRRLALAGVLFGLATLTRAVIGYLVPLLVPWMLLASRDLRGTLRGGAALLGGFVLVLLPWHAFILQRYDGLVFVSTQPGKIWYHAYNASPPGNIDYGFPRVEPDPDLEDRGRVEEENPVHRSRAETRRGLEFFAEHPLLCFQRFWVRVGYLLNPTSFLVRHLREGLYEKGPDGEVRRGPPPVVLVESLVVLAVGAYLVTATLGVLGLVTMPAGATRNLVLLAIAYFVLVVGLTYATSRYRLLFLPLLLAPAAYAAVHLGESLRRLRSPGRGATFAVAMALLVYAWSLHWGRIWGPPA